MARFHRIVNTVINLDEIQQVSAPYGNGKKDDEIYRFDIFMKNMQYPIMYQDMDWKTLNKWHDALLNALCPEDRFFRDPTTLDTA